MKSVIIIVVSLIVLTIIGNSYYSLKEYKESIQIYITKIDTSDAYRLRFYDRRGKKHSWQQNVFMTSDDVKVGDSLSKAANSPDLHVYRRDDAGRWKIVYRKKQSYY